MNDWPVVAISDVSRRVTVGFVGSQTPYFVDDGVPLLRGKNIKPWRIEFDDLKFISNETHEKWSKSALTEGDVVIVRVGYPGTAAVVPAGLGDLNAASLVIVRPDFSKLDPHFLTYVLNSPWGKAEVEARFVGSAQQVLNTKSVADLRIPLPNLQSQRRLVDVLKSIDDLIENNRRRIEVLEEMAQAIYREWFVHFRFPGHEDATFVDSPLGPIPEGWSAAAIGDRFGVSLGGTPPRKRVELWCGDIPWVNSGSVNDVRVCRGVEFITDEAVRTSNTKLWPRGTTLIAITGATLGQVSRLAIAACANQSVVGVTDPDDLATDFLYGAIRDRIDELIALAGGSAQQHINKGDVERFTLISPPAALVEEFGCIARPMNDLLETLLHENDYLRSTRDLLLPKLVTGEIDVSQLDLNALVAAS